MSTDQASMFGTAQNGANEKKTKMELAGTLEGHGNWVTSIAVTNEDDDLILTGSRDKTIIAWKLERDEEKMWGTAKRRLKGHSHFVSDVTISSDGQFALSGSWDGTLRLWDISTGETTHRFTGHTKDVLSVAFSFDNRQIVSGSRDKTINLWNTLGECKFTLKAHDDWISCVRFSPLIDKPLIVSASWDKVVKVWNLSQMNIRTKFLGHEGYVNTVCVSPDGSLCASGGKDGKVLLWALKKGRNLSELDAGDTINQLVFSPSKYWLAAATASDIKIWDLESRELIHTIVADVPKKNSKKIPTQPISISFSSLGGYLFAGYTDNKVRIFSITN